MTATSPWQQFGTAQVVGRTVLCAGEFDAGNAGVLRAALERASREGPGLLVDLTAVTFVDSMALNAVWAFADDGPVVLVAAGSLVERVVHITGLQYLTDVRSVPPPPRAT